jgi:signal transduction histidine kinase
LITFEYNDFHKELKEKKDDFIKNQKEKLIEESNRLIEYIKFEREQSESLLKSMIRDETEKIYNIMNEIYKKNRDKFSDDEIKKIIIETIRDIRFYDGRGYFFIDSITGDAILPEYEGRSMLNNTDLDNKYIMRSFIQIVKEGKEGFHRYSWYAPNDKNKHYDKIAFVKHFEPFDWIVGTGEYLYSIERDIEQKILKRVRDIRFGTDGYFTILGLNGDILILPSRENLEGKNYKSYIGEDDKLVYKITKDSITLAENGGGFIEYDWYKIGGNVVEPKLSYVKKLDSPKWALVVGIYLDDLEKIIKHQTEEAKEDITKEVSHIVSIFLIALIIAIIISLIFARTIEKIFNKYKEKIDKYNRELEDRVQIEIKRRRDNEKLLIQQSKLADMGDMIGNIAHQWRQPLNVLALNIQDVDEAYELKELDNNYINDFITRSMEQINYMSQTIDDFRNFFKPNQEKSLFSIRSSIENTKALIETQFREFGISITINGEDTYVYGYLNELSQVILNIFNNSRDSILIKSKTDVKFKKLISVDISQNEKLVIVSITDNGIGIKESIIDRVFEPYFTTKDKNRGTGIGLYMSKTIIENNMNGKIYIDKSYKDGARIYIEMNLIKQCDLIE